MQAKIIQYSNGSKICVSYASPVAAYVNDESGFGSVVLSDKWEVSPTTQSHVVAFLMKLRGTKLTSKEIRSCISSGKFLVVPQNDIYRIVEPQ
jgi:hypothetical protein